MKYSRRSLSRFQKMQYKLTGGLEPKFIFGLHDEVVNPKSNNEIPEGIKAEIIGLLVIFIGVVGLLLLMMFILFVFSYINHM